MSLPEPYILAGVDSASGLKDFSGVSNFTVRSANGTIVPGLNNIPAFRNSGSSTKILDSDNNINLSDQTFTIAIMYKAGSNATFALCGSSNSIVGIADAGFQFVRNVDGYYYLYGWDSEGNGTTTRSLYQRSPENEDLTGWHLVLMSFTSTKMKIVTKRGEAESNRTNPLYSPDNFCIGGVGQTVVSYSANASFMPVYIFKGLYADEDDWEELNTLLRRRRYNPKTEPSFKLSVDGDGVASNKGTGNYTLTAQTAGYPVVANSGLNGNPVFDCDGVNNHGLNVDSPLPLTDDWTIYIITEIDFVNLTILFAQRNSTNPHYFAIYGGNVTGVDYLNIVLNNGTIYRSRFLGTNSIFVPNYNIITVRYNSTTFRKDYAINGVMIEPDIRSDGEITETIVNDDVSLALMSNADGTFTQTKRLHNFEFFTEAHSATEIASYSELLGRR